MSASIAALRRSSWPRTRAWPVVERRARSALRSLTSAWRALGQGIEIGLLLALRALRLQRERHAPSAPASPRRSGRSWRAGPRLGEAPRLARIDLAEGPARPLQRLGPARGDRRRSPRRPPAPASRHRARRAPRARRSAPRGRRRCWRTAPRAASGKRPTSSQSLEMSIPTVIVMLWSPPGLVMRALGSGIRSGRRSDEGDQTAPRASMPKAGDGPSSAVAGDAITGNGPHTHPRAGKTIRQGRRRPCGRTARDAGAVSLPPGRIAAHVTWSRSLRRAWGRRWTGAG